MNQPRSDLRLLLKLMDGSIPSAERNALRERLATEKTLRQRWQRVNELQQPSAIDALECEPVSPDDIAAFLDGTMAPQVAMEFENKCWDTPAVLSELVSLSVADSPGEPEGSGQLTNRLLALGPQPTETVVSKPAPRRTSRTARDRQTTRPRRTLRFAMAGAMVVLLGAAIWFALRTPPRDVIAEDEKSKQIESPKKQIDTQPDAKDEVVPPLPPAMEPDKGSTIVDVPQKQEPLDPPPRSQDQPDVPKPKAPVVAAWEFKGLVGARSSRRMPSWNGVLFRKQPLDANYITLEASRAVSRRDDGSEFVVGEGTEIVGFGWGEVSEVTLLRGQVAFRNLPEGAKVRFNVSGESVEASAHDPNTTLSVSTQGFFPRVAVYSGAADVGSRRIKKNRFIDLNDRSTVKTLPPEQRKGNQWIGAWYESSKIEQSLQSQILASQNFQGAVAQAKVSPRAGLWFSPERNLYRYLNSTNESDRAAALRWLLKNPPNGSGSEGALVLVAITQQTSAVFARKINMWLDRIRKGQSARDLFVDMADELDKQNGRAPRYVAVSCLRYFSQRQFGYDVTQTKAQRAKALSNWKRWARANAR